jgi:hypothetical protein
MPELIFFLMMFAALGLVLLAWRLGREWLMAMLVLFYIMSLIFAAKFFPFFGLQTSAANIFYAAIFIGTDILAEHRGIRLARRAVWINFLAILGFLFFSQVIIYALPDGSADNLDAAMREIFAMSPRLAIAGLVAYLIAQNFDVWLYHRIMQITGKGRLLWLRNCASTLSAQLLDSLTFYPLAFAGTIGWYELGALIVTGYAIKSMIALFDTPFLYLSYSVRGRQAPGLKK